MPRRSTTSATFHLNPEMIIITKAGLGTSIRRGEGSKTLTAVFIRWGFSRDSTFARQVKHISPRDTYTLQDSRSV